MKQKLLPLALGVAVAMPAAALAEPKVYGKINVSLENVDNGNDDAWELKSNASRLGVKGDIEISDSLTGVYQIELQVDVADEGGASNLTSRNQYIGLTGSWGSIMGGRHDTPFKFSQGKVDLFGDLGGDLKNVMSGDVRGSDVYWYQTPKIADSLSGWLALVPGEVAGGDRDGLADTASLAAIYSSGPIYAAFAYDSEVPHSIPAAGGTESILGDGFRLTGQYKMDAFTFGALFQMVENTDEYTSANGLGTGDIEATSFLLSGSFAMGSTVLKLQYAMTDWEFDVSGGGSTDGDNTLIAIGADFKLNKQSKVFVYYADVEKEVDGGGDSEGSNFGVGVEHKF